MNPQANELADYWETWGVAPRWLKAMRQLPEGLTIRNFGGGLPQRKFSLLPFCLGIYKDGVLVGGIEKLADFKQWEATS